MGGGGGGDMQPPNQVGATCQVTMFLLVLTIAPELGLEPAWSRKHRPAFGAVGASLRLPEAHGRKHVRHVVAMVTQVNLGAGLQAEQNPDAGPAEHHHRRFPSTAVAIATAHGTR